MRLVAEAEPGCDPATLRERLGHALALIREWVRRADGDELLLLLEAPDASIEVASGEAKIRVEVPLIKVFEGRHYVTIERVGYRCSRTT